MNPFPRLLPAAATPLLAGLCLGAAQARPPIPVSHPAPSQRIKFDIKKFIPVSELKPGMRGYALTVFKGTKIEKFGIEILGVMAKYNAGKDYIMFRALDGPPVTRHLNIAHGMSGSPIYINGRLAGAISMGDQYSKDPIGFATPIEDMLDAWSPDLPSKTDSIGATADGTGGSGASESALAARGHNFQQLDLPVTVSGVSRLSLSRMQAALAPFHFDLMSGGGGGGTSAAQNPLAQGATLQPGSAVGVSLVQGDMDLTATGTVTYRDGNRLLLFGHPFTNFGPIDAALTTAYVVDIFPSWQDSVKYGSPIKTVGRIFQDRPFSVGGLIGSMPQMIPLTVSVNDESLKQRQTFHIQVINHPLLTGQLVTQMAGAAITQVHGQPGDSIATVTMDADVEQIGHVHRTNSFYDAISVDQSAIADVDGLMRLLSSNPFYPLQLKSMKLAVTIRNRHDTAEIDHIFLKQGRYAPGDTIHVGVVLKPYKRDMVTRDIAVKIPPGTPNGVLTLNVKGGGSDGGGISLGGLILMRPQEPMDPTANVTQLVKQFVDKPSNDQLITRLVLPTNALTVAGEKLTSLPPTLSGAMLTTHTSGLSLTRDEVKEIETTPYIVSGSQSLSVVVQQKPIGDIISGIPSAPTAAPTPIPPPSGDIPPADPLNDGDDVSDIISSARTTSDRLSTAPPLPAEAGGSTGTSPAPTPVPPPTVTTSVGSAPPAPQLPSAKPLPIKTVGRLASVWRQGTTAEFSAGTLQNVSVTSTGDVRLAASLTKLGETGQSYLWSLLPDGQGRVFAGTGDHGYIYKIDAEGKPTLFFKTGQLEVTSLARDGQGNLYAGTAPHGIVYKVGPDGTGKAFFTAAEKYVTALAYDSTRNRLYVATGGGTGRIYAIPETGVAPGQAWFTSPEAHLLSLALDAGGNVFAGSSPDGIVYKITPEGNSQVFFDTPDQSIAALTTDADGDVYAGTMPKGTIYKVTPDGSFRLLSDRATTGILGMTATKDGTLYACAGNTVYRIGSDETVQSFVAPTDEQFLSVAADASTGQVYTGTATVGSLYTIRATGDLHGQFVSTIHDAGLPAHWGSISWTGDTPTGTHVSLQTRSGNVARPDDSWSAWSSAYETSGGQKIQSPPGRYLQYQATLTGNADAISQGSGPKLRQVTVYYLPRNQAPAVKLLSPAEGDALSKATLIRWTGGDPDKDVLTFDLSYSGDGGRTWTPIKKKATPQAVTPTTATGAMPPTTGATPAATPPATGPVTDQEVAAQVQKMQADLAKHPEIPPAVRQQIIGQLPAMARQILASQRPQTGPASDLKESSYTWDSTEVPDGTYELRVVASDKISNPQGALTATSISAPFIVANTVPVLSAASTTAADKTVTITGIAKTGLAFVKAVQAKVDGGDPIAAVADDGLFDSPSEGYSLVTPALTSGTHRIDIQTVDQAGNTATKSITVKIS